MSDAIYFNGDKYISAHEVAHAANLTRDYVARLCRSGKVSGRRIGKNWYVDERSFSDFLATQEQAKQERREQLAYERMQEYKQATGDIVEPAVAKKDTTSLVSETKNIDIAEPVVAAAKPDLAEPVIARIPRLERMRDLEMPTPTYKIAHHASAMQSRMAAAVAAQGGNMLKHASDVAASPLGVADAAIRALHVPTYTVTPFVEFAHKLVAFSIAFSLTFGVYALVDPSAAHFTVDSVKDTGKAIADSYERTIGSPRDIAAKTNAVIASTAENPRAAVASAASAIGGFLPNTIGSLARAVNEKVNSFVYAIAFPRDTVRSAGLTILDADASVDIQIAPYARGSQSTVAVAPTGNAGGANGGALGTTVVQRVETQRIISAAGGLTEAQVEAKLQTLESKLMAHMFGVSTPQSAPVYYNSLPASGGIANQIAISQRIDNLSGTNIARARITESSIAATDLSADSASLGTTTVSGNLTVNGTGGGQPFRVDDSAGGLLFAINSDGTIVANTASTTSSYSSLLVTGNATATNFVVIDTASTSNLLATNATSTNLFASFARFTSSIFDAFTATNATTSNLYVGNDLTLGGSIRFTGSSTTIAASGANFNFASTSQLSVFQKSYFGGTSTTTIDSAGNVGIGTSNAQAPLDVVGNGYFRNAVGAAGSNDGVEIATDASAPRVSLIQGGRSVGLYSADAPGNTYFKNVAGGAHIFTGGSNGGTEIARLTNVGNFGLGTTTPFGKLAISLNSGETYTGNNAFIISSSTASATTTLFRVTNSGVFTFAGAQNTAGLSLTSDASGNYLVGNTGGGRLDIGATDGQVNLRVFGTNTWAFNSTSFVPNTVTNTLDIGASNNVFRSGYFGTSLSTASLIATASSTIGGGTQATGLTISGGATTTGSSYIAGGLGVGKVNTTSGTAYIGDNTTSFGATLDVVASGGGNIRVGNSSGSGVFAADGGGTTVGSFSNHSLFFRTGNTTRATLDTSGNFGIGTTSPATTFSVAGSGYLTGGLGVGVRNTAAGTLQTTGNAAIGGSLTLGSALTQGYGGTGFSAYTAGDILYADNSGNLARLPIGSAGTVLKVQAGLPAWGTDLTSAGGGGGSGTNFFSTTTDNLIIYPTDTSKVVAIGTNSTSSLNSIFEVAGQSYFSSKVGVASTSPFARLSIDTSSLSASTPSFLIGSTSRADFIVTALGNVGIGTVSPASIFHINNAASPAIKITDSDFGTGVSDGLDLQMSGTEGYVWNYENGGLHFATNGSERQTIMSNGYVGFGTTTPWGKLSVTATDNASTPQFVVASSSAASFVVAASGNVGIGTVNPIYKLHTNVGTNKNLQVRSGVVDATAVTINAANDADSQNVPLELRGSKTYFQTGTNGATTALFLDSTGNVGIGTTTPINQLTINGGTFAAAIDLDARPATGGRLYQLTSTANANGLGGGKFAIYDASASAARFLIDSTGNVGIGTTTPGELLHIYGTGNVRSMMQTTSGSSVALSYFQNGDQAFSAGTRGDLSDSFSIYDESRGISRLTVTTGGNFGIGTTTPTGLLALHANSGTNYPGNLLFNIASSTASATTTLFSVSNTGNVQVAQGNLPTGGYSFVGQSGAGMYFSGGALQLSDGSNTLALVGGYLGNTNSNRARFPTGALSATVPALTRGDDTTTGFGLAGSGVLTFISSGNEIGRFSSTGNFGIGTTTPLAKLTVSANSADTNTNLFLISSSTASATSTLFSISNSGAVSAAGGTATISSAGTIDAPMIRLNNANLQITTSGSTGRYQASSGAKVAFSNFNNGQVDTPVYIGSLVLANTGSSDAQSADTNISRLSAGVLAVGTGAAGSTAGTLVANSLSVGSTTPFGALAVSLNNGAVYGGNNAFIIASSTASATSTLFSVSNTGVTTIGGSINVANSNSNVIGGVTFFSGGTTAFNGGTLSNVSKVQASNIGGQYLTLASTNATGGIIFNTGADVEAARINSSGYLGIGTTTPFYKLSVTGADSTDANNVSTGSQFAVMDSANTHGVFVRTKSSAGISGSTFANQIFSIGGNAGLELYSDNKLIFGTSNTERLRIDTSGNVGIGTTSTIPYARLSVMGNGVGTGQLAEFYDTASTTRFRLLDNGTSYFNGLMGIGTTTPFYALTVASSSGPQLALVDTTAGSNAWTLRSIGNSLFFATSTATATSSVSAFSLNQNGLGTFTNGLNITSGNLGVGTTSPWGKLAVTATDNASSPQFVVASSTAVSLFVNNLGNVGVGTISPTSKLYVGGSLYAAEGSNAELSVSNAGGSSLAYGTNNKLFFGNASYLTMSGTANYIENTNDDGVFSIRATGLRGRLNLAATGSTNPAISFTLNNTEAARFDLNNNFGIGSSTPWARLAVTGSNTSSATNGFLVADSNNSPLFVVKNSGSVGVGTTTPGALFNVNGTATYRGLSGTAIFEGAVPGLQMVDTDGGAAAVTANGGALHLWTLSGSGAFAASNERLTIDTNGYVGIGSTTPASQLTVYGGASGATPYQSGAGSLTIEHSSNPGINMLTPNGGIPRIYFGSPISNTAGGFEYTTNATLASGKLAILAGGSTAITVLGTGNVGIGTTSTIPYARLSVMGNGVGTGQLAEFYDTASTTRFRLLDNGTSYFNGLMGIGTTTPFYALTVASSSGPQLALVDTTAGSNAWTLRSIGNSLFFATSTATATSSVSALSINQNGFVGVGSSASASFPLSFGTNLGNKIGLYDQGSGNGYGFGIQAFLFQIFTGASTDDITFGYGNSNSMTRNVTFKGSGYVGIGSTTPASQLTVYGGASGATPYQSGAGSLTIEHSSNPGINMLTPNGGIPRIYFGSPISNTAGGFEYTTNATLASGKLAILAGGSTAITVLGTGNVGIGTTTPGTKLDVYNTSSGATADQLYLTNAASATSTASRLSFRAVDVTGNATTTGAIASILQQNFNTGLGDLTFSTLQTGSLTEVFRATGSGNVGIGTTTPLRKLSVSNTASVAQVSIAYDTSRTTELQTDSSGDFVVNPSGDDVRINDDNLWVCAGGSCPSGTPTGNGNLIVEGKLGVGTSTPQTSTYAGIGVGYTLNIQNVVDNQGLFANNVGHTGSAWKYLSTATYEAIRMYDRGSDGSINFHVGASAAGGSTPSNMDSTDVKMTIVGNGRVGIGTTTPTDMLSVEGLLRVGASSVAPRTLGTATSTFNGDIKIIGKLDVSTIDPVYMIGGTKYATYGHSTVGIHEETLQTITLEKKNADGKYAYTIDFNNLEKGSDLWLFYQITDFGGDWKNLVVSLTPSFDSAVYYKKLPGENKLVIYANEAGEVSMRLAGTRYDFSKWPNLRTDQDGDAAGAHVVPEKK